MIENGEKRITKKHIGLIAASGVLAILITAYIVMSALIGAFGNKGSGAGGTTPPPDQFDPEIGEVLYMNSPAVYSYLSKAQIQSIAVVSHPKDGTYTMQRAKDADGKDLSYFLFYYLDEDGRIKAYMPEITMAESGFNYTDFYAVETVSGLNATKIEYLIATLGILYYDYKVPLKDTTVERNNQLKLYGLTEDERETIEITYLDSEGKEQKHKIIIGDKLTGGAGYYLMIDDRDCIYAASSSTSLSYALSGFKSIIHSRIVAAGLPTDKTFEPYLTTDYKQWKNYYRDVYYDENGNEVAYLVAEDSEVIFNADVLIPIYETGEAASEKPEDDGYFHYGRDKISFNLKDAKSDAANARLIAALLGKPVDKDGTNSEPKTVTVVNGLNSATLFNPETGKGIYTYTIKSVESVLTDTDEYFSGACLGAKTVKVIYDYKIDGVQKNDKPAHAVISLEGDSVLPAELKEKIYESEVGEAIDYTFEVKYTSDNAKKKTVTYVITQISLIAEIVDDKVNYLEKVGENSIVSFSYHTVITDTDGTKTVGKTQDNQMVDLSKITEGYNLDIKNALVGASVGTVEISVPVGEMYYQHFDDFIAYEIQNIEGFIERELVTAFRFANASERDPFYAETSYKNTIAEIDPDNPYAIYALEVESCDTAVRILGGISLDGSSQNSAGLVGSETVAVGLTPEVMKDCHLYEGHTVYFELPRGIGQDVTDEDDYTWASELGFTLYISPAQEDGTRFVASDMYDIVVKIEASSFNYLDESFPDFWARKNLAMINHTDVSGFDVKLNFEDLVGEYSFRLEYQTIYIDADTGAHYLEEADGRVRYDFLTPYVSIGGFEEGKTSLPGVYDKTGLSELLVHHGKTEFSLAELYNFLYLDEYKKLNVGHDTMGAANFKELLKVIYSSYYMGTVDVNSDEIKALLAGEALMTFAFDVQGSSAINKYVYEFRRLDDRRIVVSFFLEDETGARTAAVSDLYISDLNFNKFVRSVLNLLNGEDVLPDMGYEAEK